MNEWSVECECGADEWMSESSADGMKCVLHELRATQVENWTVLSCYEAYIYIYIYYDRSVWARPERRRPERKRREKERDKREKTGIKSVCLEDGFRLHWNQQHHTWAVQQHTDNISNTKAWAVSQHTETSNNTKAWAVSQHTDTSNNTKAWAVSQHTDTSNNTNDWFTGSQKFATFLQNVLLRVAYP